MPPFRRLVLFALLLLTAGAARVCVAAPARARPVAAPSADTVLVAARELQRGAVLRAADIDTVIRATPAAAAHQPNAGTALPEPGWIVRRLVRKGEPLRAPAVAPPALITAGASVTLVWHVDGMRLTRQGTAVGAAYRGQAVVVRVDATRRFTGIATAAGTVEVAPP